MQRRQPLASHRLRVTQEDYVPKPLHSAGVQDRNSTDSTGLVTRPSDFPTGARAEGF